MNTSRRGVNWLMNWVLEIIADNVFGYLLDHSSAGEKLRTTLKGDPIKTAFQRALETAFAQFERRYPHWASALFDQHFFEHAGAAILAQFLLRDGQPDAQALVDCWIASMGVTNPQTRATRSQDLLPAAQDFLTIFEHALKAEPVLRDIANDRAVEQTASGITAIARDISAIRERIERPQSRPDPRIPYLHWLIERNLYLDPRGTYQTQRQVQVKLAEVYISLRAVRDDTVNQADRYLLEQEMTALQTRLAEGTYSAEVVEDLSEQVQAHFTMPSSQSASGTTLELAEAVANHNRLVILGDPGSGKTTLVRYLALTSAQALCHVRSEATSASDSAPFPILIRIADYAEYGLRQGLSLSDFLPTYCRKYECPGVDLATLFQQELSNGHGLVLLDGLDEIASADDRLKVVQQIEAFVRHHSTMPNRIVITSRIAGYRSARLDASFIHYVVQEMDEQQIRRFLSAWCPAVEAAQTPDLSPEARALTAQREIDGIMHAI